MKRRGSNDSGGFWMGNPAAGTPKKLPGVQHCLEVRRLSETHGVVVFCVEHFGFFTECAFEEGWGCHESDRCELQVTEADLALQVSFYVTTRSSDVDGLRTSMNSSPLGGQFSSFHWKRKSSTALKSIYRRDFKGKFCLPVFPATAFRGVSDISHKSYKRAGCSVGPFAEKKDGYESFSIHNNGIWGNDTLELPRAFEENLPLIEAWMGDVHGYTECILSILSKALNLSDDLKDCHRKDAPSSANMAMLNYLPWGSSTEKVGNMAHTDMGTLTVVFTKNEGLQVFEPQTEQWYYIKPRPGHAVVNVGDSLRFLSNGALASNLHRVVPPANPEGLDKFSCIYFLRPEFDAKFTSHDGREMNSVEWHNQKYALFREASLDAKQHGAMLTGRNGYLGATTQTV
ncbi:unnamed protein product [Aspergillus oryzae]|uniref:Unnamed protein product n=2 Tax=Aspergillus oryzae TaxID=5062 RepID=A0AAN4YC28_ASPOZ|nr:unnamed protein product [Aspergillus oryzae]GMF84628.1 unnamed protein product [Aspergillus oryzae]GMG26809.1 unnamed protein product [Aspergillus oryzae]GMG47334.1 unnamed protein product [Aspergillus oryzae var. brunneus]